MLKPVVTVDSRQISIITHALIFFFSVTDNDKNNAGLEKDRILQEKEAELRRMQEMLAAMQAQMHKQP